MADPNEMYSSRKLQVVYIVVFGLYFSLVITLLLLIFNLFKNKGEWSLCIHFGSKATL